MRLIVCDTGPILHLLEAGLLSLLESAGKVCIPDVVNAEMVSLLPIWEKDIPRWLSIEPLTPQEAVEAESLFLSGMLDMGEAGAIVLSRRLKTDWFLTDDTEARIFAGTLGIEVHGSLGIVLWSAAIGHITQDEAMDALDRLSKTSLWISKNIMAQARTAIKQMFTAD